MSSVLNFLSDTKPIYKELKGWNCVIEKINTFNDLPENAKTFINYLSKELQVPIIIISIGPKRNQILQPQTL